ncbi:MAG: carboxypeptidase-like regulatory domain-containing protein [Betaproteobacteria bacterium]
MNTLSFILFFVALPVALFIALAVLMQWRWISLLEACAFAVTSLTAGLLIISSFHPWPFFTDWLAGVFFVLVLPIAVTIYFHKVTANRFTALFAASGTVAFCALLYGMTSQYREMAMMVAIPLIPILVAICAATTFLIKLGAPLEQILNAPSNAANRVIGRRLKILALVAGAHLVVTVCVTTGYAKAEWEYDQSLLSGKGRSSESLLHESLGMAARVAMMPLVALANPRAGYDELAEHPTYWILFSPTFWISAIFNSLLVSFVALYFFYAVVGRKTTPGEFKEELAARRSIVQRHRYVLVTIIGVTSAIEAWVTPPALDFGITGTVLDAQTRRPIEGAYVLAMYTSGRQNRCAMAKGMHTGADGKFSFPVTALNYTSPQDIAAIKSGYYAKENNTVRRNTTIESNPRKYFSGRNIVLTPQADAPADFTLESRSDNVYCEDPPSQEDAIASFEFLKTRHMEMKRLGKQSADAPKLCLLQNQLQTLRNSDTNYCDH